ncbi:MAG: hypothetical protein NTX71_08665 [Candidatus Aureabacteria bacterium]|nr:hypothetical protein [Candidatus Auribacterota bacterium]
MTDVSPKSIKDGQHHRDSCAYSVEIAKQFLTLGSAGVAFVVGMALQSQCTVNVSWYWASGFLIASVGFGLLYLGSVVAHVNQHHNYDVYTGILKWLAVLQILSFVCALVLLGVITLHTIGTGQSSGKIDKPNVDIQLKQKSVKLVIPEKRAPRLRSQVTMPTSPLINNHDQCCATQSEESCVNIQGQT